VRYGNAHPTVVPYQLFTASDGAFALAVGNDRMFADFCTRVIGRPDLAADPRFVTARGRALNRPDLLDAIQSVIATRPMAHWLAACVAADVPAGPVKSVAEALQARSVVERGVIETLDHPELGPVSLVRAAQGLAAQAGRKSKPPPLLGEDTRAVLRDVLGLDAARIDALVARGVVACHDAAAAPAPRAAAP
jgi:crotonobetainyl-CoA:carnitine CoA-transferase CaiB-like acyl-CoA transferase